MIRQRRGNNRYFVRRLKRAAPLVALGLGAIGLLAFGWPSAAPCAGQEQPAADPWSNSQVVMPAQLLKELGGAPKTRPTVVYVGFDFLYQAAHVPGAIFFGPARQDVGLDHLKAGVKGWPRDRDIVIYCGCCPFDHCPNVRPAFTTLKEMGFTHLRVLYIPHEFRSDWLQQGYPVEKSLPPTK